MESPQNNIWPSHIERIVFHRSDPIQSRLKRQANTICRNMLNEEYIRQAFNRFRYGYYYKDSEDTILGFCIWKQKKRQLKGGQDYKYIHILLICAEQTDFKMGKMMLFDIDTFALKNKVNDIKLEAASEGLIPYYKDSGFLLERDTILPLKEPFNMYKQLSVPVLNRKKGNRTRKSSKTISQINKFTNTSEFHFD